MTSNGTNYYCACDPSNACFNGTGLLATTPDVRAFYAYVEENSSTNNEFVVCGKDNVNATIHAVTNMFGPNPTITCFFQKTHTQPFQIRVSSMGTYAGALACHNNNYSSSQLATGLCGSEAPMTGPAGNHDVDFGSLESTFGNVDFAGSGPGYTWYAPDGSLPPTTALFL